MAALAKEDAEEGLLFVALVNTALGAATASTTSAPFVQLRLVIVAPPPAGRRGEGAPGSTGRKGREIMKVVAQTRRHRNPLVRNKGGEYVADWENLDGLRAPRDRCHAPAAISFDATPLAVGIPTLRVSPGCGSSPPPAHLRVSSPPPAHLRRWGSPDTRNQAACSSTVAWRARRSRRLGVRG